jgi:hypothetical protein
MSQDPAFAALQRDLPRTLSVYPHQIDLVADTLLMVELGRDHFLEAAFLDQRVLRRESRGAWFGFDQVSRALGDAPCDAPTHFIFHIGHCGSTLLSRLLAECGGLPVREPLPLRTLAELLPALDRPFSRWSPATFDGRLELLLRLWARGREPRVVKATSFCNDLAAPILQARPQARAIFSHATPRAHVANLLAGANSRIDLMSMAPTRLERLQARLGEAPGRLWEMSPGVVAAMSWACEMASLASLEASGDRVLDVDFDRFLADLPAGVAALAAHVLPAADPDTVAAAATSPAVGQYSKAPEHAYDAKLRRRVLADAESRFAGELRAGLDWLEGAARRFPAIAAALERFGSGGG